MRCALRLASMSAEFEFSFSQPLRKPGITKNNVGTIYDMAMLGNISQSGIFIWLTTMGGVALARLSLGVLFASAPLKILSWDAFGMGMAPALIGLFPLFFVQLILIALSRTTSGSSTPR